MGARSERQLHLPDHHRTVGAALMGNSWSNADSPGCRNALVLPGCAVLFLAGALIRSVRRLLVGRGYVGA